MQIKPGPLVGGPGFCCPGEQYRMEKFSAPSTKRQNHTALFGILILISNEILSFEMRTLRVLAAFYAAPSHKNSARFAR